MLAVWFIMYLFVCALHVTRIRRDVSRRELGGWNVLLLPASARRQLAVECSSGGAAFRASAYLPPLPFLRPPLAAAGRLHVRIHRHCAAGSGRRAAGGRGAAAGYVEADGRRGNRRSLCVYTTTAEAAHCCTALLNLGRSGNQSARRWLTVLERTDLDAGTCNARDRL